MLGELTRLLRAGWRVLSAAVRMAWWLLGTLCLGGVVLWRLTRHLEAWPLLLHDSFRCPRGHETSVLGTWTCSTCRAAYDGYAFGPCPTCRHIAGWVPCSRCGLPVINPLFR